MAKHLKTILAAIVALMAAISCEQEIMDVNDRLDNLESRVSALEELVGEMNSNISSLQSIVTAIQTGDYITSVNSITTDGKTIGYTITFAKGDPISIYHGEAGADGKDGANGQDGHTPVIGVKQDTDGVWYWTIDGEWLLDSNNQKVKAVGVDGQNGTNGQDGKDGKDGADGKDGVTPQLKIEDGYWYVSTDNGATWTQLGKATGEDGKDGADGKDGKDGVDGKDGDSMFQSVTVTETEVTFVTSDGQTFVIRRAAALSIEFDSADLVVMGTNSTRDIHYTITSGFDDITIEALSSADIKVKVNKTDAKTGTITVKTGATIDEYSKVVVLVNNGSQAIMRTLNFEAEAIEVEENTTKEVSDEGGEVTLEFFSNVPCHAVIPEDAQSWISVAPETKALTKQSIGLIVQPNTGLSRSATVNVVGDDDASSIVLSYTVTQDVGGVWKEGTIPPDNEIWYVSIEGSILQPNFINTDGRPFNCEIVSNTYNNGKGVITLSSSLKRLNAYAFCGTDFLELFLPDSVEEIGYLALFCNYLNRFRVPEQLKIVDGGLFNGALMSVFSGPHTTSDGKAIVLDKTLVAVAGNGLKSYSIPNGIEEIGCGAFKGCTELENVYIPEGVTIIGREAFDSCNSLRSVTFPNSLKTLDSWYPFLYCYNIESFNGNPDFITPDHKCAISYVKGNKVIVSAVRKGLIEYEIPEGITGIQNYAFDKASELKKITFPSTMTVISPAALEGCNNIEEIWGNNTSYDHKCYIYNNELQLMVSKGLSNYTIPEEVNYIAWNACRGKHDLESLIIHDGVLQISDYVFNDCPNLKSLTLSSNLTYIGHSPFDRCNNLEAVYLRAIIPPSLSSYQYQTDYEKLTIYVPESSLELYNNSMDWAPYKRYFKPYNYSDLPSPDFYISSDYSSDGTVTPLQHSTTGAGIDLIFMGDAFSDRQIADGTYANVMQKAVDAFFSEEPYKSMKDCFNVYTVNVVSATEGYEHSGQALGTGHGDGTYCYGNDTKVIEYAKAAIGEERMDDAVVIVMMNEDAYAGTCFMYYPDSGNYGRGLSIAYFPTSSDTDTFNGLVSHEAGGHGFAKLADEYAYEYMGEIPSSEIASAQQMATYGWWKNIDFTGDPAQVKWSQFIADDRYAGENIGCYEGAYTYWTGAWRPTENSIMRYNTGGFNAPSRYAIWYRIGKLAYGETWEGSYEDFVTYDAINRTPAAVQKRQAQIKKAKLSKPLPPLAPPVVVGHSWREEIQKGK